MRLFVKAQQVMKHCIEKENIPLNYTPSEYDGTMILAAQVPTVKPLSSMASPPSTSTSITARKSAPILKDFVCSIW